MKKIMVFTKYFVPTTAGREINIYETYSSLVNRGWDVTIHTSKSTHEAKNVLPSRGKLGGIRIIRHTEASYMYSLWATKLRVSGSIVSFHGLEYFPDCLLLLYFLLLKIARTKDFVVVFTSHGLYSLRYQFNKGISGKIKRLIDKLISLFILNKVVDGYRAVSNWEANYMHISGIKNVKVIQNGLPSDAFTRNHIETPSNIKTIIGKSNKYVIQVGRVDRIKNYETMIKALPDLEDKSIKYLIVGPIDDQEYKEELDSLISHLKLAGRILFLGEIVGLAKYALLRHAKAHVQMSFSEGYSGTVNEAMSQGCICIVSENTAMGELVRNNVNGFTLKANDSAGIAKKIDFILNKSNKRIVNRMKLNNLKAISNKPWKDVSIEVEKFYVNAKRTLANG